MKRKKKVPEIALVSDTHERIKSKLIRNLNECFLHSNYWQSADENPCFQKGRHWNSEWRSLKSSNLLFLSLQSSTVREFRPYRPFRIKVRRSEPFSHGLCWGRQTFGIETSPSQSVHITEWKLACSVINSSCQTTLWDLFIPENSITHDRFSFYYVAFYFYNSLNKNDSMKEFLAWFFYPPFFCVFSCFPRRTDFLTPPSRWMTLHAELKSTQPTTHWKHLWMDVEQLSFHYGKISFLLIMWVYVI